MSGTTLAPRVAVSVPTARRTDTAWMDFARVAGMLAVVAAHVFAPAVRFDLTDYSSPAWLAAMGISGLARFCVPLFIAISGALLLAPQAGRPALAFYRRRWSRIGIPLVAWCAFYLGLREFTTDERLGGEQAAREVLEGGVYYHLYFLFVLAGLYALTPFLRLIVLHASNRMLVAFTGVLLTLGAIDQTAVVLLETDQGNAATEFLPFVGYFVGGLLVCRLPLTPRLIRTAWAALVGGVALTTVGGWVLAVTMGSVYVEFVLKPLSPSVMLTAFGAMVLLRTVPGRAPRLTSSRTVARLSALSFGVYLVHPAVLTQIHEQMRFPADLPGMVGVGLLTLAATLVAATAITALGRAIPGLRRAF